MSKQIKNGEKINQIKLKRLPDNICANKMPYEDGALGIEEWISEYYDINTDIEYIWE